MILRPKIPQERDAPMTTERPILDLLTIETPRLVLRKITLDDAQDVFEYASDPEKSPGT